MKADILLEHETPRTARSQQIAGLFDVSLDEKLSIEWHHNLPVEQKQWQVGLIVGASGAGKSVLARQIWADRVIESFDWTDKAVIDQFPKTLSINQITDLLTSVGFGTVPSWLRPYSTLSNGERFRVDMARAIAETADDETVVIDEFTSVVDRQVARIASNSVQKAIRRSGRKLVAVTCHYDVIDWLQPEWVYDVTRQEFTWRSVQPRPSLRFNIFQATSADWKPFARHHYMSSYINPAAQCFLATVDDDLCAFMSYIHFPHPHTKTIKMGHRLVVYPDYQGLGIATYLMNWTGQYLADRGYRFRNVIAHPAMIALHTRSPRWRETHSRSTTVKTSAKSLNKRTNMSTRRLLVRSFEYQPPRMES